MSSLDTIFNILKGAHPDASDEDIKSYIDSAKASPDQMDSAVAPLSMSKAPDMALNFPSVNDTKSTFDTGVSDNTVTNDGKPESLPAMSPPSSPVAPEPVTPPPAAPPAPTANAQDNSDEAAAAASVAKPDDSDALKAALAPAKSGSSDAEAAFLAQEKRKKNLGAIPVTINRIGDAIGNAAKAVGGSANTNTGDEEQVRLDTSLSNDKKQFDEKEKKDPNSDISRHYQKVLGLMLGAHAKDMGVEKMSAEHIASTLPEVEKYMQKELGLKQIQSNKELQMAMHEQTRQDKLEKDAREWVDNLSKARNGEIGVQNGKVDQARHLLQVYKQAEESGEPISNSQYGELAIGAASLVAGGANNVSDHTKQMIMQSTAKGDLNHALTYAGFDPSTLGGSTDSVLKNLKHLIIRQGLEAETQRDKFINDQKSTLPSGLNKEQADKLLKMNFGNSVKDFIKQPASKAPPKATSPEGTVKTIGNRQFTVMNGIWHEVGH